MLKIRYLATELLTIIITMAFVGYVIWTMAISIVETMKGS